MRRQAAIVVVLVGLSLLLTAPQAGAGQIELDRLVSRVNGTVITQSDLRRVRALKLVADVGSDEVVQRELENRLLMLGEVNRSGIGAAPNDDAVAARRRGWDAAMAGQDVAALLTRHGMTDASLMNWIREDVRIDDYIRRQFGSPDDPGRPTVVANWIARLRQRAGLR